MKSVREGGDRMITPGLYQHYRNREHYRVLCVVRAYSGFKGLVASQPLQIHVAAPAAKRDGIFIDAGSPNAFMTAQWSGNGGDLAWEEPVVIYVALYDDGRISARPLKEFEEDVTTPCADSGPSHRVPRFERIGD